MFEFKKYVFKRNLLMLAENHLINDQIAIELHEYSFFLSFFYMISFFLEGHDIFDMAEIDLIQSSVL